MKTIIALIAVIFCGQATADNYINGYVRRDGTYVAPHFRSDANNTNVDNYSYQGNTNPYNGNQGYDNSYPQYHYQQQPPLSTAIQYNMPPPHFGR